MKYTVFIEEQAEKDIKTIIKSGDKASIKKLQIFLDELEQHPTKGQGQPEELKNNLSGYWSRRINKKDRLIYKIEEELITVIIVAALGHYGDK
jgi:toxin YoeB